MLTVSFAALLILLLAGSVLGASFSTPVDSIDPATGSAMPPQSSYSTRVVQMGQGIARAEGYGPAANLPTIRNNPGSLTLGGTLRGFPDPTAGWNALYGMLAVIERGSSKYYPLTMTFEEFGWMYVNGTAPGSGLVHSTDYPHNWAVVVAGACGLSPENTLSEWFEV